MILIIFTVGVTGGGGEQELHSDVTFQFISANETGPPVGGESVLILSAAGSCVMTFILSGQGNKVIAYLKNPP